MSEYWKSNPKKFCEYCKCWLADNKPCIQAHEKGKRHLENVAKKLEEAGKKGKAAHVAQSKMENYMKKMEEAALKAYKKDIDSNPDMMGSTLSAMASASGATIVVNNKDKEIPKEKEKKKSPAKEPKETRIWREVKTTDGRSYYWNTVTSLTIWKPPKEGYISVEEQNASMKRKSSKKSIPVYGPAVKAEPFSSWQTVEKVEQQDLQLPEQTTAFQAPQFTYRKPQINFDEKVVTLSQESDDESGASVSFKKRKRTDCQRNVRQRIE